MRYRNLYLIAILMAFCLGLYAQPWYAGNGVYRLNGIHFRLDPEVIIRESQLQHSALSFSSSSQSFADSVIITYSHPAIQIHVKVSDNRHFHAAAKQVEVAATYADTLYIRDFDLKLNFTQQTPLQLWRGPDAIYSEDASRNANLYPYTDRALQYVFADASLWLVGSNYAGCANLDWISEGNVHLYDNALHFARRYNPANGQFDTLTDTMKRRPGESSYYSFLIFEDEPVLLKINRWLGDKAAALVITNDADGESPSRMRSVYFGSSDPRSPKYLNHGVIANNLKLTNTVFGASKPVMAPLWRELQSYGIKIGYHTYGNYADLAADTYQNLVHDMTEFDIRTWIDHSWAINPDDLCVQGWNPESDYYSLPAINDAKIDYIWLGDASYTNPLNSFTEPWRLPHRLYEFDHLTRPVWFYGRTLMGTWEATGTHFLSDLKHQLTAENLDRLLNENGLSVVYTHFFFTETPALIPFYEILPNGTYEVRPEVNERLQMLDYYQNYRGLWIDTLEDVFDRMLAIEELRITSSSLEDGKISVELKNGSSMAIPQLSLKYQEQPIRIEALPAQSSEYLSLNESGSNPNQPQFLDIVAMYSAGRVHIVHKSPEALPALNIELYNIRGQKLSSHSFAKNAAEPAIPFFKQASGIYIARVRTPSGFSKTLRFTVIK